MKKNERFGAPGKAIGFVGERTSDTVSEPCCMQRGEGYEVREDERGEQA